MGNDFYRLAYYSRNRVGSTQEEMAAAIAHVLASARRNNSSVDVTGALMFNAGCFAQVLEGPEMAVMNTFERIQQDERHGDVTVLSFGPVAARVFDRWSMGFIGESHLDARRYDMIVGESGYDPATMTGDALLQTLHRLVLEEENAAATWG